MFDQLCLLAEGRTAYMGSASDALSFLEQLNFICPEYVNPADFIIRTLAVTPGKEIESRENITRICDAFHESAMAHKLEENVLQEFKNKEPVNIF